MPTEAEKQDLDRLIARYCVVDAETGDVDEGTFDVKAGRTRSSCTKNEAAPVPWSTDHDDVRTRVLEAVDMLVPLHRWIRVCARAAGSNNPSGHCFFRGRGEDDEDEGVAPVAGRGDVVAGGYGAIMQAHARVMLRQYDTIESLHGALMASAANHAADKVELALQQYHASQLEAAADANSWRDLLEGIRPMVDKLGPVALQLMLQGPTAPSPEDAPSEPVPALAYWVGRAGDAAGKIQAVIAEHGIDAWHPDLEAPILALAERAAQLPPIVGALKAHAPPPDDDDEEEDDYGEE